MKSQITTALYPYYLFLSKLCERIALNQLMPYLVENDRLSAHQSGNKKWHSTETSMIYTSDRILTAIDQKKTSAVVLLDMSKAFENVNHDILLKKLQDIGLSPSTMGRTWLISGRICLPCGKNLSSGHIAKCDPKFSKKTLKIAKKNIKDAVLLGWGRQILKNSS